MELALKEALKAGKEGEVPVGAVIVGRDESLLAKAHNQREKTKSALAHAEILAIEQACLKLSSWRLEGCSLYVTLEPCMMCAGALLQARIKRLIYGCADPKMGCARRLSQMKGGDHKVQIQSGLLEEEGSHLLKKFFKQLRA